jgi:GAF domain-containing protein
LRLDTPLPFVCVGLAATSPAVEGHSPWTRDVKDPKPVCIQDIEAADLPKSIKDIVRAEQIGALAFFPLVANDALVGKFMTYYDARHVFGDGELTRIMHDGGRFGTA